MELQTGERVVPADWCSVPALPVLIPSGGRGTFPGDCRRARGTMLFRGVSRGCGVPLPSQAV